MKIFETVICFSLLSGYAAAVCNPNIYQKEWSELSKKQKKAAQALKWKEGTWDLTYGVNPITEIKYWKIRRSKKNKQKIDTKVGKWQPLKMKTGNLKKNLKTLGIDSPDCFDKLVHHYGSYTWNELKEVKTKDNKATTIQEAYSKLGWTENSWNEEEEVPLVMCKFWEDMSNNERRYMKVVGYLGSEDWRFSYYPPIDKEKEARCIERMKTAYPEKYSGNKRIYDKSVCEDDDYTGLYKKDDNGNCVLNYKCNAYGSYFVCEELLVKKWCSYDCKQYDECKCYSPKSYCNSYPGMYEKKGKKCVPKDWCDIHDDYYEGDKSSYETDWVKEMVQAHDCF